MNYEITIIIPVYIFQNDFKKIELILVDDGSTDMSSQICDEYANKYENIRVFHKLNGGLSDARNYGIMNASGKYLIFIDSDDMVSKEFFNIIFKSLEKDIDILLWNAECIDENDNEIMHTKYKYKYDGLKNESIYSSSFLIKNQLKKIGEFPTVVWLAAYKKNMIINNNLWFEKGLLHEDEMWTMKTILHAKNIKYICDNLYKYRKRENSITSEVSKNDIKHIKAYIYIYNSLYSYYEWKVEELELMKILQDNLSKRYLHTISCWKFDKYPNLLNKVNTKNILKYSISWKNRIRAFLFFFNKKVYCKLTRKK